MYGLLFLACMRLTAIVFKSRYKAFGTCKNFADAGANHISGGGVDVVFVVDTDLYNIAILDFSTQLGCNL